MTETTFLDKVYDDDDGFNAKSFYADWAKSYEAELKTNGYVTPGRCAEALKSLEADLSAPIIDLGCGTGLSGLALRAEGFTAVDGADLSPEMLSVAKTHGCYRTLETIDLSQPLTALEGRYRHAVAAGVVSPGHAPASTILQVLGALPSGGTFVFSLNDHALAEPSFEAAIMEVVDGGWAMVTFKEYGPHIPARDFNAMVYGLTKR